MKWHLAHSWQISQFFLLKIKAFITGLARAYYLLLLTLIFYPVDVSNDIYLQWNGENGPSLFQITRETPSIVAVIHLHWPREARFSTKTIRTFSFFERLKTKQWMQRISIVSIVVYLHFLFNGFFIKGSEIVVTAITTR